MPTASSAIWPDLRIRLIHATHGRCSTKRLHRWTTRALSKKPVPLHLVLRFTPVYISALASRAGTPATDGPLARCAVDIQLINTVWAGVGRPSAATLYYSTCKVCLLILNSRSVQQANRPMCWWQAPCSVNVNKGSINRWVSWVRPRSVPKSSQS